MNAVTHLSINLFPMIMLIIIFFNNKKRAMRKTDKYWFKVLNASMIAFLGVDIVYWVGGEYFAVIPGKFVWSVYMLYQLLVGLSVSAWFLYVYYRIHINTIHKWYNWKVRLVKVAFLIYAGLILTTPWTHLMFYVTEENHIVPGPLFLWQYLLCLLAVLWAAGLTIWHWFHENSKEVREECAYLILFNIISFGGVMIQALTSKWWVAAPCVALAVFMIYVNTQNRQITTDSLTGLNNRREFDQYIHRQSEMKRDTDWGMLMLDLDDFKQINDEYGHKLGDEALWETADILRHTLGKNGNFLARFGGDEFVVIGAWKNEEDIKADVRKLQIEADCFNKEKRVWTLSYSIGYALWSEIPDGRVESLIGKADERMYQVKQAKKHKTVKVR